ncbi:PREDICTED: lipase 3-like [Nicrophorus vespilloides]|uniref:Lipase n=1 Tax=Nicrophorus vespilloides TaxID=110193 RepID=A0ABM1M7J1_NICVS|nr:PREDICTED: lipase 3-like [Nicrophorus vespilloides]
MLVLKASIFFGIVVIATAYPQPKLHSDAGLNALELIEKYEYPIERHNVVTDDGYILEMHRIPHGRTNAGMQNKEPVLVMHGLLSSSADWVNFGEKSLGFILADLGYDVWLGNARGSRWSRKHVRLSPDYNQSEYWSFSWNEIGKYDLPAKIDYIINNTGHKKIFYIGHSQGTTSFWVMGSERPEYNDKIRLMAALGPVAYMQNLHNPTAQEASENIETIQSLIEAFGLHEFLPYSENTTSLGIELCDDGSELQEACLDAIFMICGPDPDQLDPSLLPVIWTNIPAGTSSKQFLHYAQGIKSGIFRQFDYYSDEKNNAMYGQPTPPNYDLSKVKAPVALYYGKNDWLAAVKDVEQLSEELGNVVVDHLIEYEHFNHLDFLWGRDVYDMVYEQLLDLMKKY